MFNIHLETYTHIYNNDNREHIHHHTCIHIDSQAMFAKFCILVPIYAMSIVLCMHILLRIKPAACVYACVCQIYNVLWLRLSPHCCQIQRVLYFWSSFYVFEFMLKFCTFESCAACINCMTKELTWNQWMPRWFSL